jgi:3-hydroxypropanoate dehydrogenase
VNKIMLLIPAIVTSVFWLQVVIYLYPFCLH